jgi:hypothetical protein
LDIGGCVFDAVTRHYADYDVRDPRSALTVYQLPSGLSHLPSSLSVTRKAQRVPHPGLDVGIPGVARPA